MKYTKYCSGILILLVMFNIPIFGQDTIAKDIMVLDEEDINSILDELIGSMDGDTAPIPVMEAQQPVASAPTVPPEDTMMPAETQTMSEFNTAPMDSPPTDSDMGASDFVPDPDGGTMASSDAGSNDPDTRSPEGTGQPLPEGFEPIGMAPEGTPPSEFGQAPPEISSMESALMETEPEPIAQSTAEPVQFPLIESNYDSQAEPPVDSAPAESIPDFDTPSYNMAPVDSAPIAQSSNIESLPTTRDDAPMNPGQGSADFAAPAATSMAIPPEAPDEVFASEPSLEEINSRSVKIADEEDVQLLITVGDKVYLPIPSFKTPRLKEFCNIYQSKKQKLFINQRKSKWYKKIGKLKIVEIYNMHMLGVVIAANDVIQKGDMVYFKP